MSDIQSFISWFLDELPSFLMTEPICYLLGFVFLGLTVKLVFKLTNTFT